MISTAKLINISSPLTVIICVCVCVLRVPEIYFACIITVFNRILLAIAIMWYVRSLDLLIPHNSNFIPTSPHFLYLSRP